MEFLGISFWEFLLIMVVIVLVLGPSRIPGIMRTLGTIVRNIRKITSDLTANVAREIALEDERQKNEAAKKSEPKPPAVKAAKVVKATPPEPTGRSITTKRSRNEH